MQVNSQNENYIFQFQASLLHKYQYISDRGYSSCSKFLGHLICKVT